MCEDTKASLYEQVRKAVHHQWDPIGVAAYSEELGEYDGYIPGLFKLLEEHSSYEKVFEYLWTMETDSMGLSGDRKATEEFASRLCQLAGSNN